MQYIETEIAGDHVRIGWAGGYTINLYTPIGGQWVEFDCCSNNNLETLDDVLETAVEFLTEEA